MNDLLITYRFDRIRDKIGVPIINWLMRLFLSPDYCQFITGAIEYGMRAAVRDSDENRGAPPDWRDRLEKWDRERMEKR